MRTDNGDDRKENVKPRKHYKRPPIDKGNTQKHSERGGYRLSAAETVKDGEDVSDNGGSHNKREKKTFRIDKEKRKINRKEALCDIENKGGHSSDNPAGFEDI